MYKQWQWQVKRKKDESKVRADPDALFVAIEQFSN